MLFIFMTLDVTFFLSLIKISIWLKENELSPHKGRESFF